MWVGLPRFGTRLSDVLCSSFSRDIREYPANATMQLIIGVGGSWKCVSVTLMDGCVPCIGGVPLRDENLEPALWFKIMVLNSVFVDCADRVISWSVHEDSSLVSSLEFLPAAPAPSLPPPGSQRSLMAPVEGSIDSILCTNDLQSLFELAEVLYRVSIPTSAGSSLEHTSRASQVEYKSWLRLLHCYLLPLIGLHGNDTCAVEWAHSQQLLNIEGLDQQMRQVASEKSEVKGTLSEMLNSMSDQLAGWVENKQCSQDFISTILNDLKHREESARKKIQSCVKNLDLSGRVAMSPQSPMVLKLTSQQKEGEQELFQTLMLRSYLEGVASLRDTRENIQSEGSTFELQRNYIKLHRKLECLREQSAELSKKKVLSMSVREAIEQTLVSLKHGRHVSGLDTSLQGRHSTDVLPEASQYSASNEYLTLKEKVHKVIQLRTTALSKEHNSFCQTLASRFSSKSQLNPQQLIQSIQQHFSRIVELICTHFNDHEQDFMQKARLSYEKLFFEMFITDFLQVYQSKHVKYCEQLALNSLGASMVEPVNHDLGLSNKTWAQLFSARTFDEAIQLYKDIHSSDSFSLGVDPSPTGHPFGGVSTDLFAVFTAKSPLDQLQMMTSAFRKAMATLSNLKLKPLVQHSSIEQVDASLAAVSFDELLPVLVLILLQLSPSALARLHVHCMFLADYTPSFLSPGWHGYSHAAFTSALHIIAKL